MTKESAKAQNLYFALAFRWECGTSRSSPIFNYTKDYTHKEGCFCRIDVNPWKPATTWYRLWLCREQACLFLSFCLFKEQTPPAPHCSSPQIHFNRTKTTPQNWRLLPDWRKPI